MPISDNELSDYYKEFKEDEDPEFIEEREEKKDFFQEKLSKSNISSLEEGDIREIVRNLWAFQIWTNKDYIVEEMTDEGIEKFRNNLKDALYRSSDKGEAYDKLIENVKMVGPASASELLTCVFPDKCGIWNRKAREGLKILSYEGKLPLDKKKITGEQYVKFNKALKEIRDKLQDLDHDIEDMLELDYFLFDIIERTEEKEEEEKTKDFDHDEMINTIAEIGDGLGFDVQKEYFAGPGARLDVKWSTKIANLGSIGYAFEVQRRGSRDSAIINLLQARKADPTIQKLVIVSTEDQIEKFQDKINTLDENFRKFVSYISVDKIEEASEKLRSLKEILQEAGLMEEMG